MSHIYRFATYHFQWESLKEEYFYCFYVNAQHKNSDNSFRITSLIND